jgi:hypothetical protein
MAAIGMQKGLIRRRIVGLLGFFSLCAGLQLVDVPRADAFALRNGNVGWDGAGLNAVTLGYNLAQPTADLANELSIIEKALDEWNNYVQINLQRNTHAGKPDQFDFYFTNTDPTTGAAWNQNTLAVGFFPDDVVANPRAGDVYFNDLLTWTGGTTADGSRTTANANQALNSCDLYFVALHEIGHALGLRHPAGDTQNLAAGAVMSPFFNPVGTPDPANPGFGNFDVLQPDDINGIRAIYATGTGQMLLPEPSAVAVFGAALLALVCVRRRLQRA